MSFYRCTVDDCLHLQRSKSFPIAYPDSQVTPRVVGEESLVACRKHV